MAKPRIFLSSTYYDLKYVRADLERFIKEQGYDPVLNENGHIPYGSKERLEQYCYKEIESCDILVSIVGGRFGSETKDKNGKGSVSNMELRTAIEQGKQVYIFIEKAVQSEYQTYLRNKGNSDLKYAAVDDVRVYEFLEEIHGLKVNNQIHGFESVTDITYYLREQWAGLFQRLMSESARQKEVKLIEDLKHTSSTLNQLVDYLIAEKSKGDSKIEDILFSNHPVFDEVKRNAGFDFRIIFSDVTELLALFKSFNIPRVDEEEVFFYRENAYSWHMKKLDKYLHVSKEIFDGNGKLKPCTPAEWDDSWVQVEDEIPF
ncbi:TPA: DUF4062 domain-containing protein [Vibrio vulnificus]|uniref:DUF4062 domain-containing protein n=1 Tax=Vibrio metschnikovii TaxID=28172 RepID=UPI001A2FEF34|nr:DUF4062 domain-containing protein [Vibrio metschnikovii]HAS6073967.1 DUF4062 domain-containing protein [Vibrio vulnificus]HDY7768324.1 DUF4062 domain-containing protein [Vibrio vulnificus]HDY7786441.1 DUF4062 domain-containing protein [Vibrio vulnificus]HDY7795596.1 DUF4062 domain-containing protein [Vibrio vulnificus]HDY7800223.1 DUF4062 domain-containing protein [Vibrio vulnificus]